MHTHALAPIRRADEIATEEHTELTAEIEAFDAFARRADDVAVRSLPAVSPGPPAVADRRHSGVDANRTVRRAYRETVMDTSHYDDTYGEPLAENATAELGAEVATAIANDVAFTPALKSRAHDAAVAARTSRERFRAVLESETESLRTAHADLREVVAAMRHDETDETDETAAPHADGAGPRSPADRRRQCQRVAADRQRTLQRQRRVSFVDQGLGQYLYHDCSWDHPVLRVVATLVDDLAAIADRPDWRPGPDSSA
jgi:hypothetical protein